MQVARDIVEAEFESHAGALGRILDFIEVNPDYLAIGRGNSIPRGTEQWWRNWAEKFVRGREIKAPSLPKTKADPIVTQILEQHFGLSANGLMDAIQTHFNAMAAENKIGSLLEAYLASQLEPKGWIWCSGETVKSIDFLYIDKQGIFHPLQVKNRDNSENSSSAAIRKGTAIKKWHRFISSSGNTRWDKFPESSLAGVMTEKGFQDYVSSYLQDLLEPAN